MNDNLILPNSMTMAMAMAIRHGFDDHPHPRPGPDWTWTPEHRPDARFAGGFSKFSSATLDGHST